MHSDKSYAAIQERIANGTLSYSPEAAAAIYAHARRMRTIEMNRVFTGALRAVGRRLAAAFARSPDIARADAR